MLVKLIKALVDMRGSVEAAFSQSCFDPTNQKVAKVAHSFNSLHQKKKSE